MTKALDTTRFLLGLATWAQETTRPSDGAGVPAAVGSIWQRNGLPGSRPTELYLKLGAVDTAWTKQNLINLNVYNVRDYGAVGDGVTDDTTFINNAIAAAQAAGGGQVYFPATANFYAIKKQGTSIGILKLIGDSNITLTGDGYASKIRQTGSNNGADTWMVQISSTAQRICLQDLYFDNSLVTDGVEQNHCIQIIGQTAEAGGPTDIAITRCYFGAFRVGSGDAVRFLGDVTHNKICTNVRLTRCVFNTGPARVAVSSQRGSRRIIVDKCWFQHSQPIHFEPTGTGTDVSPEEWNITRNLMKPAAGENQCGVSLSGAGTNNPSQRSVFALNTMILGKVICAENLSEIDMIGNVILRDLPAGSASNESPVFWNGNPDNCVVAGNVIVNLYRSSAGAAIKFQNHSSGVPNDCLVANNVVRMLSDGTTTGIGTSDATRMNVSGNLVSINGAQHGILFNTATTNIDNLAANGNMVLIEGGTGVTSSGIGFNSQSGGPPPSLVGPIAANANYISGDATNGLLYFNSGKTFPVPAGGVGNMGVGFTGTMISTAQSVTVEGNSTAPAAQITQVQTSGGPGGSSPAGVGSLNVNGSGGDGTALSTKEADGGVNTGWIGVGGTQVTMGAADVGMATTDLFLAPGGADLPVAQAAEIFWVAPRDGRIIGMRGRFTAGTGGGNNTYTVRRNGSNSAVAFNVANTGTSGSSAGTLAVSAGDRISIRVTKASAPTTPQTNAELTLSFL